MLNNGCKAFGNLARSKCTTISSTTIRSSCFLLHENNGSTYRGGRRLEPLLSFRQYTTPQLRDSTALWLSNKKSEENDTDNSRPAAVVPTWEYKEYVPPRPPSARQRRRFSTRANNDDDDDDWQVPRTIFIPEDKLEISFSRSSGAGGQNVNKVNSKVDIRFHLMEADWIPLEVRERIMVQAANRINKDGYLNLAAQEHRTQPQNRKTAVDKLREIILQAYPRPKIRKVKKGISKAAKERNKAEKRKRSDIKANRRSVDF